MIQGSTAVAAGGYGLFGEAELVAGGNPGMAAQLRSDATPGYGGVDFDTAASMTLSDLQNLSTDYKVTAGTCAGGSPRFQINVLGENIFVYIGTPPNYVCTPGVWTNTGDLLEAALFVDTSQLAGGTFYDTWASALLKYGSATVTGIQLVADGGWAVVGGTQTVLVDNVTINTTIYTFDTVVVNPSDKEDCKKGGWEAFTTSPGPFKNQGDCVSYFATGGKNKASD